MEKNKRKTRERMKRLAAWVMALAVIGNMGFGDLMIAGAKDQTSLSAETSEESEQLTSSDEDSKKINQSAPSEEIQKTESQSTPSDEVQETEDQQTPSVDFRSIKKQRNLAAATPAVIRSVTTTATAFYPGNEYEFSCEVENLTDQTVTWSLSDSSIQDVTITPDANDEKKAVLKIEQTAAETTFKVVVTVEETDGTSTSKESGDITVGAAGTLTITNLSVTDSGKALEIQEIDAANWINSKQASIALKKEYADTGYDKYRIAADGNWTAIPTDGIKINGIDNFLQFQNSSTTQITNSIVLHCDGEAPAITNITETKEPNPGQIINNQTYYKSQKFQVEASDNGVGIDKIYYYDAAKDVNDTNNRFDNMTVISDGKSEVTFTNNKVDKAGFYVEDKLGNRSPVSSPYEILIDSENPLVTVITADDSTWNQDDNKFYSKDKAHQYIVQISDADTGIDSYEGTLNGTAISTWEQVKDVTDKYTFTIPQNTAQSERFEYKITATDKVGNVSDAENCKGEIIYDIDKPVIKSVTLPTEITNNANWINAEIAKNPIYITITAEDNTGVNSGIGKLQYKITKITKDAQGNETEELKKDYADITANSPFDIKSDVNTFGDGVYKYYFKAIDKAGNESAESSVNVQVDIDAPITAKDGIQYENAIKVDNLYYFNEDNKTKKDAQVSLTITEATAGMKAVEYAESVEQGTQTWKTASLQDNKAALEISDNGKEGKQSYDVRMIDKAGNQVTYQKLFDVNWDTETPYDTQVSISDSKDKNNSIWSIIKNKGQDIKEFITGKKSVWIDVYTKDDTAGVKSISCTYKYNEAGTEQTVELKKEEQGIVKEDNSIIYHFREKVEINKEIDAEILSVTLTDNVNNSVKEEPEPTGAKPRFIIDNTAPALDVEMEKPVKTADGVAYYDASALNQAQKLSMKFTLTEDYFLKGGNTQYSDASGNHFGAASEEIKIEKCDYNKSTGEIINQVPIAGTQVAWTRNGNVYEAEFQFEPGYKYIVTYQMKDGAVNPMTGKTVEAGTVDKDTGIYTYTFAIDTTTPEGSLAINGTKRNVNTVNGVTQYYYNSKPDTEKLTAEIRENMFFSGDVALKGKYAKPGAQLPAGFTTLTPDADSKWNQNPDTVNQYLAEVTLKEEGTYQFSLDYTDRADHQMKHQAIFDESGNEAFVVVDKTKPVVKVSHDRKGNEVGDTTYYSEDSKLTVQVADYNFNPSGVNVDVKAFDPKAGKKNNFDSEAVKKFFRDPVNWKEITEKGKVNTYICTYTFDKELSYSSSVTVSDWAGNVSVKSSEKFVVDKTNPVINDVKLTSVDNPKEESYVDNGCTYFNCNTVNMQITVKEHNFFSGALKNSRVNAVLESTDVNGKKIESEVDLSGYLKEKSSWKQQLDKNGASTDTYLLNVQFHVEANYTVKGLQIEDMSNRQSPVWKTEEFTIDRTLPEITYTTSQEKSLLNYLTFGLFGKESVRVTATVTDGVSGIHSFVYSTKDMSSSDEAGYVKKEPVLTKNPVEKAVFEWNLSPEFKGKIAGTATDYSQNYNQDVQELEKGVIVESEAKHKETAGIKFTVPEPNKNGFYNQSIDIGVSMSDSYSGIQTTEYGTTVAGEKKDVRKIDYSDKNDSHYTGKIKTDECSDTIHLEAQDYYSNYISVYAGFEDNAGNKENHQVDNLKIDNKKPEISVEYDNNNPLNERYYNQTRTATVRIQERNFDAGRTELVWTSTGEAPSISEWHSEGETHTAYVTFQADADYTFTVKSTDLADNTAEYSRVDEFTVDQTTPVIQVSYDNNSSHDGNYYNAARTATIQITEHNFNAGEVQITGTATENGAGASFPGAGGWSSSGDVHTTTISYSEDAHYTFSIACTDLAGNAAAPYQEEQFAVDKTKPTLKIRGVKNESANNQTKIGFVLEASDNNFGTMSPKLKALVRDKKGNFTTIDVPMTNEQASGNAHTYVVNNLTQDGIYTLSCSVTDKAGNSCDKVSLVDDKGKAYGEKNYSNQAETLLEFSVNRDGSTYRVDLQPEKLNNGITNAEAADIHVQIEEINVDELQEKETRLDLYNGLKADKVELKKGVNYKSEFAQGSGGWRKYTYTLAGSNFEEDGNYQVGVYSVDKAGNESDSLLKNKAAAKVSFIVDRTNPELSMNVGNKESYNQVEKKVELNITELHQEKADIEVKVNGEKLAMDKDIQDNGNGQYEFTMGSGMNQNVQVICVDQAGNKSELSAANVTVSTNLFVRTGAWIMNNTLIFALISMTTVAGAAGLVFWRIKVSKKKKIEIDEE